MQKQLDYKVKSFDATSTIIKAFAHLAEARDCCNMLKLQNNKDYFIVNWYYQIRNTREWDNDNIHFL